MTDSQDLSTTEPSKTGQSTTVQSTTVQPKPAKTKTSSSWLGFTLLVNLMLGITSIGLIAWGYQEFQLLKQQLANAQQGTEQASLQQALKQAQSELSAQASQLSRAQNTTSAQASQIQRLQQQLVLLESRWQSAFKSTQLERQIEHLATMLNDAQRQLFLTQSPKQARLSLEKAENECRRIPSGAIQNVCDSIRQDLQRLSSTKMPDHAELIGQLDLVHTWIDEGLLKQRSLTRSSEASSIQPNNQPSLDSQNIPLQLKDRLALAMKRFQHFIETHIVKVHRSDSKGLFSLTVEQSTHLKQEVDLLIQQARSAIIQKDTRLYFNTMQELERLTTHYEADFRAYRDELNALLAELKQINIEIPPDLSLKASQLLNQMRESLHQEARS